MNDSFSKHTEPEDVFLPLDDKRYAEFYSIEMDAFTADIDFYKKHCSQNSSILELGCGTGRISKALALAGYKVTGIDISTAMLKQAKMSLASSPLFICMDMSQMAFKKKFDHIIIPYNTLNLLRDETLIRKCLFDVHSYLSPTGALLLQLHIPEKNIRELNGKKLFQFQMFPLRDQPGKLIKETLRSFSHENQEIRLEERYRVRPTDVNSSKEDLSHTLHLAGVTVQQWLKILLQCGFQNTSLFGDYNSRPFCLATDSTLLIKTAPSLKK